MKKETGGPAFPRPAGDYNGTKQGNVSQTGMTLRDYFAAKAMEAVIISSNSTISAVFAAEYSYQYADAMLAARGDV